MADAEVKNFSSPDEVREFPHVRMDVVQIGGGEVGLIQIEPGWRWSEHVKPVAGTELCEAPHFQYVISGRVRVRMADGSEFELRPGDVNVLPPATMRGSWARSRWLRSIGAERTSGRIPHPDGRAQHDAGRWFGVESVVRQSLQRRV
jgi:quercetin dioxygenase-like cupin family protein